MNTIIEEKHDIAGQFLNGLKSKGSTFSQIMTGDLVWRLPGTGVISGEARGLDCVIRRASLIVDYGMHFELKHILYGESGVALSLHNSASRGNFKFDQDLVTVLSVREGKVFAINTYMSDVAQVNTYFVPV